MLSKMVKKHFQMKILDLFQIETVGKQFQMLEKNGWKFINTIKTLREKKKLLITNNFSFSLNVP